MNFRNIFKNKILLEERSLLKSLILHPDYIQSTQEQKNHYYKEVLNIHSHLAEYQKMLENKGQLQLNCIRYSFDPQTKENTSKKSSFINFITLNKLRKSNYYSSILAPYKREFFSLCLLWTLPAVVMYTFLSYVLFTLNDKPFVVKLLEVWSKNLQAGGSITAEQIQNSINFITKNEKGMSDSLGFIFSFGPALFLFMILGSALGFLTNKFNSKKKAHFLNQNIAQDYFDVYLKNGLDSLINPERIQQSIQEFKSTVLFDPIQEKVVSQSSQHSATASITAKFNHLFEENPHKEVEPEILKKDSENFKYLYHK